MRTPEGAKKERISHLQYCLEKLTLKDNGYNTMDIERLYSYIYRVICDMEGMNATESLEYFNKKIDDDVRNSLLRFNIELIV